MHQHLHPRGVFDATAAEEPTSTVFEAPVYTADTTTSVYQPAQYKATRTSTATDAIYTCDPDEAFFLNGCYLSRFSRVSSYRSGLTDQDIDLYNRCYLPYNNLPYHNGYKKREESWVSVIIEKPDYQLEEAPCKRAGAIGANCYWQNNNGTFAGLDTYKSNFTEQQHCYCEKYPYWDATAGCQRCLELHGGIEGYHWFPESHISAYAEAYCGTNPESLNQDMYHFYKSWSDIAAEAKVPSTTAKDILGTQTAASLYYTATPVAQKEGKSSASAVRRERIGWVAGAASALLCVSYLIG